MNVLRKAITEEVMGVCRLAAVDGGCSRHDRCREVEDCAYAKEVVDQIRAHVRAGIERAGIAPEITQFSRSETRAQAQLNYILSLFDEEDK